MPCPQIHYFYDGTGKIDANKVKELLGNQVNKVVAWYKFQHIGTFKFTLRDKLVHKQLTEFFGISPEYFTCGLLINEISENRSTHIFTQSFGRYYNNIYDKLPVYIPNLSEPNNTYKNSEPASETFNKILSNLKTDRKNTPSLVVINKIESALQNHIDSVVEKLAEAEQQLYELEEEVRHLEVARKKKKNDEDKETVDSKKIKEHVELMDVSDLSSRQNESSKYKENNSENDAVSKESSPEGPRKTPQSKKAKGRGRSRGRPFREVKDSQ